MRRHKIAVSLAVCALILGIRGVGAQSPVVIDSIPAINWQKMSASEDVSGDELFSRLIQEEWLRDDKIDGTPEVYRTAAKLHLAKANELLDAIEEELDETDVSAFRAKLQLFESQLSDHATNDLEQVYAEVRGVKRKIIFSNPLYQNYELLFCKRVPGSYSHLVAQYLGWRARSGGGIFVLEQPGKSLQCRDLTGNRLPAGSVLEPRLSYDAQKVVFSFVDLADGKTYDPVKVHFTDPDEGFYHIYTMDVDGNNLKQITAGSYDDVLPNWLPDGDIVFSSTRRKGYARCFWWGFGKRWNTFTIHRMKPDGSDIKTLSWHDTNEWFPMVANDGTITYARWDYIDRDAVTHQNFWSMRPDGTNPKAVWGNATPNPHCVFQARPIPGTSKYVFTAAAHHSITGGSLALLDPSAGSDGLQSLTRITPNVPFPETEGWGIPEYYESPYPLSEEFYIVSYSPYPLMMEGQTPNRENATGIYAYDIFGNRELIYRDPKINATTPIPLRAQEKPVLLNSALPANSEPYGEMTIENVYEGLGPNVKPGSIKEIRIVQIFPKTTRDLPPVGLAGEENARAILGTVPVEEDGSAFFRVPAQTPILLQVLDEKGQAWQTMRSLTYLQPGERVSCVGCHESKDSSAFASTAMDSVASPVRSLALQKAPAEIEPGDLGGRPFSFVETIQPILDAKCIECHNAERTEGGMNLTGAVEAPGLKTGMTMFVEGTFNVTDAPSDIFTKSYYALCEGQIFYGDNGQDPSRAAKAWVPRFGGRNTIQLTEPGGHYGSLGCRLIKYLDAGHEGVILTETERRHLATWVDLNAVFYGVYDPDEQKKQLNGQRVDMPEIF
ncbi:MAG: hypothetical protein Q4G68_13955 [Planctomycetia bacterium]|nr:hypothetical protein [Planctomycetia bacterium]